jgi:hypothetical protein
VCVLRGSRTAGAALFLSVFRIYTECTVIKVFLCVVVHQRCAARACMAPSRPPGIAARARVQRPPPQKARIRGTTTAARASHHHLHFHAKQPTALPLRPLRALHTLLALARSASPNPHQQSSNAAAKPNASERARV